GILLVDRTNHNRERGMEVRAALLEAGPARLRAILMTSTTIAIALFPTALKFGDGAELRAPLAATVFGGIISSTLLTLVLVPVMYTILDSLPRNIWRLVTWPLRLFSAGPAAQPAPGADGLPMGHDGSNGRDGAHGLANGANGHTEAPTPPEEAKPVGSGTR